MLSFPQGSYVISFFSKIIMDNNTRIRNNLLYDLVLKEKKKEKKLQNISKSRIFCYIFFFSKKVLAMDGKIGNWRIALRDRNGGVKASIPYARSASLYYGAIKQPRPLLFLVGVNFIPGCTIPWADSLPPRLPPPRRDCFRCADLTSFRYPSYSIPGTVKSTRKEGWKNGCREN